MGGIISTRLYREFRAEMKAIWQAQNAPCWMDGQPIDYDGPANAAESFELDHAKPRKTHPHLALDPNNARPSHSRCNRSRQTAAPRPGIGQTSEEW
jgi:5-methylcytosine-specific restriction endonuclease McrA